MATRSRHKRARAKGKRAGSGTTKAATRPTPAERPEPAEQQPAEKGAVDHRSTEPISKAIYLSALIYIEGEQPPADDFMGMATAVLKETLGEALKGEHNGLTMSLKSVEVRNDIEEDDGEGEAEEKFQF